MALAPIAPAPGIVLSDTSYTLGKEGQRWTAGSNMEFVATYAQKIAGWQAQTSTAMLGIPRCMQEWRDNVGLTRVAIGTTVGLYQWQPGAGAQPMDITPLRTLLGGSLNNPISTSIGNPVITIADTAQRLVNGDWVFLSAASAVGGVTVNGWYSVMNRTSAGYQITSLVVPNATAGPGGGAVSFQYPRINLTNPFAIVNGSKTVTVTDTSGVAAVGGYVIFAGSTPFGGVVFDGTWPITSVSGSTYTFTAATAATATAVGGGTVSVIYEINVPQTVNTSLQTVVWGQVGLVWGQAGLAWGTNGFVGATLPDAWTLAAYGSQMLAAPVGGTIYVYDPAYGGRAYPLQNAPLTVQAMFVTPERFVVALGINGNLMKIAWADQNDYTVWTTTPTNTANSGRTFVGGSYFVGGIGVRDGVSLIFTNRTVFQLNYTGGQEIYNSPQIGDNCGLVSPTAVCQEGGLVYWMSDHDWWTWNGGVSQMQSDDVRETVYNSINRAQIGKCTAMLNRAKRQVRFFWPSGSAAENDTGMIYQFDEPSWSPLAFGRTCGNDANLLSVPISSDTSGLIYYEETGTDANGLPLAASIQTGTMDVSNGDRNVDIFGVIPDFKVITGNVYFTALASYYPNDTLQADGPWIFTSTTERIDLRLDGKLFAMKLEVADLGATFRVGVNRLDVQPSGARR